MDDEARDDREDGAAVAMCGYPDCDAKAKREGLCFKHLQALCRGDESARQVVRDFHSGSGAGPATPTGGKANGPRRENARMGKHEKQRCDLCGREIGKGAFVRHRAACKGPAPTGFKCPTCAKGHKSEQALHAHQGNTGHAGPPADGPPTPPTPQRGLRPPRRGGPAACGGKRKKAGTGGRLSSPAGRSADFGRRKPAADLPRGPQAPLGDRRPDGIAAVGHAATRLIQIIGLSSHMADFPHPDGHCFMNTQTGQAAIVTAAGEIRAAEVIVK